MNHTLIAGNLGADPEVRYTSSGTKVTTIRVACNSRRSGKDETTWWKVTVWGEHLDKIISFLKKGSSVIITGELQKPEIYNDREGNPQVSLNLTANNISFSPFGGKKGDGQQAGQGMGQGAGQGMDQGMDQGMGQGGQGGYGYQQQGGSEGGFDQNPFAQAPAGGDNFHFGGYDQGGQSGGNSAEPFSGEEIPF
ncbi:MAG: Single-stranded DNA-binding protein [Chlamydiia bacterium]|nr:Single-stranded DNA-binding protein [Chlamydiia bacterium]